ncbi:hypothetical protein Ptr902_02765 [Pyrenophora tritici-repentis]|nr:hypothetical protein PtrV1_07769 [Pyrenophora tritici-repentis]KAF7448812.1 hypothetical protein A1F99_058610 [Pyrenophora tritici-repentis]KAI2483825.1 hypothetical protein Ptr902_02765 [Pyrenophora tritici-repentis]
MRCAKSRIPATKGGADYVDPASIGVFRLFALIKDGPYAQNSTIQYSKKGLSINVKQDGRCRDESINYASLTIPSKDASYQPGGLFLYTDNPPMEAYVDRSWMGQGLLQFTQGVADKSFPRNGERGPWAITKNNTLLYDSGNGANGFQACTEDKGKTFRVFLAGVSQPAGFTDCTRFTAQVWPVDTSKPENANQCSYDY